MADDLIGQVTAPTTVPDASAPRGRDRVVGTHSLVWVPAVAVGVAMLLPAVYLVIQAAQLPVSRIVDIAVSPSTLRLTGRTLGLAAAVTGASVLLGVPVAWLTVRSDLPARRFFAIATAMPLVIPSYVGAYALIAAIAPGGLVESWLGLRPPSPYGFGGVFLALTLFSFPYVIITVQAALRGTDHNLEQASRSLGHGPLSTFLRVTLPQLRASAAAGGLLVTLYVLSDFGAVSLLRYSTFTRALYLQYRAAFERAPAAVLGLVLVVLTVIFLVVEARVARTVGAGTGRRTGSQRPPLVPLGRWKWPAVALCCGIVLIALVIPVTVVIYWLVRGLRAGEPVAFTIGPAWRSILAATLGAVAAVAAALPVAIWTARSRSRIARLVERASYTGYALPGIVVAFALVFMGIRFATPLYQTLAMLIFAYVVLFLPQATGAIRATLLQVPGSLEDASRTLGASRLSTLRRVTIPLASRGAVAGGALVFLTVLKELPATLLLAPTGYDTLATRVWSATAEAFFTRASVPALTLILLGSVPLAVMMIRRNPGD